jgi:transcription elongation factor GreA
VNNKPTYVSREGLERLHAELDEMIAVKRPENAEYEEAKNEQAFVEGRIAELEHKIKSAVLIDEAHSLEHVSMGSTVEVVTGDDVASFTIVGSTEAKPGEGRISNESPVGRALLGKRVGEQVVVKVPAGDVVYTVRSIR